MAAFEQSDYLVDKTPFTQTPLYRRVADFATGIGSAIRQYIVNKQTRSALERLNDRHLADIGLTRDQIESFSFDLAQRG
jgi:uncharacterized protein YjiS (DUF1127 family)